MSKDWFKGSKFQDDSGNTFPVEAVIDFAEKNKSKYLQTVPMSKIEHDLKYWQGDEERMMGADTKWPILVIDDGGWSVADGLNRMKKAHDVEHKTKMTAYVVPKADISHLGESLNYWEDDGRFTIENDPWLVEHETVAIESDAKFSFIRGELLEARYIRIERQAAGHTMADISETFFEHMMMLQQLRYENPEAAKKYAKDTLKFFDFSNIRGGATDLHNLASIIMNPDKFADTVGASGGATIPEMQFKRWLRDIKNDKWQPGLDRQFLFKLEKQLGIKSSIHKKMRRIMQDYSLATPGERKMVATRLMLHFRQDRRHMSDVFKPWADTINKKKMVPSPDELDGAKKRGFKVPLWVKAAGAFAIGYQIGKRI